MDWIKRMRKRFIAAFSAALFLLGMPASAEYSIGVPTLGTHPLLYNYIGTFQCIVTNHSDYAIETNVTLLNHASESAVASQLVWVPPRGEGVVSYQSFSSTLENYSCWATLGHANGFNNTIPNCQEEVVYIPRFLGGAMASFHLTARVWDWTANSRQEGSDLRYTKMGVCNDAS